MTGLSALIKSAYGITTNAISPAPGGFSAKATYRVAGADGVDYFLKVYDKTLPTTRFFVDRIDLYMPALAWLAAVPALRGRILTPIPTRCGTYKAAAGNDVYVLFLFVHGVVPGIDGMTPAQTVALAETLALLHSAGADLPYDTPGLAEDISLSFCDQLLHCLNRPLPGHEALREIVSPHAQVLRAAIYETLRLRDAHRVNYAPLVLCHGDAHGNNVIQGERLVLADWEDLRWAPAEADLFIHAWHPHGDALLEAYSSARHGYSINRELLYFYTLRRRIEDLWVDIQRLTAETPTAAETEQLLDYTRQGIEAILALRRNRPE